MFRKKPRGTQNVLVDLGFEDAEELSAKAMLAMKLNALLERRQLSQSEAAELLEMPQPKISLIRNYKLQNISLERLMQAIVALGQQVEIVVKPASGKVGAGIRVAA